MPLLCAIRAHGASVGGCVSICLQPPLLDFVHNPALQSARRVRTASRQPGRSGDSRRASSKRSRAKSHAQMRQGLQQRVQSLQTMLYPWKQTRQHRSQVCCTEPKVLIYLLAASCGYHYLSTARWPDFAATGAAAAAAAAEPAGATAATPAAAQPSSPRDGGGASPRVGHRPTAFVRNIHRDTTDEELQEIFAECGAIKGMRHVRHPAGTSKVCAQQNEYHEWFNSRWQAQCWQTPSG